MKLLISGATGFIGGHLARRRLQNGDTIATIAREDSDTSKIPQEIEAYRFDGDQEALEKFLLARQFDGLIHLATHFSATHTTADIPKLINSNILFGTHLFDAATRCHVPWVINTSTFTQHFESKAYSATNLYSATKQALEDIALYYTETTNTAISSIAPFDTFGPGDRRKKLMNILLDAARNNLELNMSPGDQIMDISPIENVIDGFECMIALMSGHERELLRGSTYALPSRERMSLRELVDLFVRVWGKPLRVNFGAREYRQREVMVPWDTCSQVPGWTPRIKLEEAIRAFIQNQQ